MNKEEVKKWINVRGNFVMDYGTYEMKRTLRNILTSNKNVIELIDFLDKSTKEIANKEFTLN